MRTVDVAVVGAGLAGSSTAVMLARKGIEAVLIDPRPVYQPDFRCEKFDGAQIELLRKAGLTDVVFPASTKAQEVWIARFGRLLDRKTSDQYDFRYEAVVNALRAAVGERVPFLATKADKISTSADRQTVELANGETVSARLVILANGLNMRLERDLGFEREVLSACHSVSIGFDMLPAGRPQFEFNSLTYFPEHPSDRMAYISMFPIGDTVRANLFVYRTMDDPWLTAMRKTPLPALQEIVPGLRAITGPFEIPGEASVRPVDLHRTKGHRRAGIVLVGDAFTTSCPAAGTGADKVFTDVERLCNVYLPDWLSTPGMAANKIAQFYEDPVKVACEAHSLRKAFLLRSMSLEPGLAWQARRWVWFFAHMGIGLVRQISGRRRAASVRDEEQPTPAASLQRKTG